jgi:Uma2 family endonuclease
MAAAPQPLSLAEFRARYSLEKPYFEYWFGVAIQKSVPTWLHAVLQRIIGSLLLQAGYKSGSELELRIDSNWQPVPDVAGSLRRIDQPYPTEPIDVVVEILSPDDRMSYILSKCRNYARIGISQIFVFDPEAKQAWEWTNNSLNIISEMRLANGSVIDLRLVWQQLDEQS